MANFCRYCGNPISEDDLFCGNCGNRVGGQEAVAVTCNPEILSGKIAELLEGAGETKLTQNCFDFQEEILKIASPLKTLVSGIGEYGKGIVSAFRDPKKLIFLGVLSVLWFVLMLLERDGEAGQLVQTLSALTFAKGGMSSFLPKIFGGLLGKCAVATAFFSLGAGGLGAMKRGLSALFGRREKNGKNGTNENNGMNGEESGNRLHNLPSLIGGAGIALILYQCFVGNADVSGVMAAVAGATLSLQALGERDGFLTRMLRSVTASYDKKEKIRTGNFAKAQMLAKGLMLGFTAAIPLSLLPYGLVPLWLGLACIVAAVVLCIVLKKKGPVAMATAVLLVVSILGASVGMGRIVKADQNEGAAVVTDLTPYWNDPEHYTDFTGSIYYSFTCTGDEKFADIGPITDHRLVTEKGSGKSVVKENVTVSVTGIPTYDSVFPNSYQRVIRVHEYEWNNYVGDRKEEPSTDKYESESGTYGKVQDIDFIYSKHYYDTKNNENFWGTWSNYIKGYNHLTIHVTIMDDKDDDMEAYMKKFMGQKKSYTWDSEVMGAAKLWTGTKNNYYDDTEVSVSMENEAFEKISSRRHRESNSYYYCAGYVIPELPNCFAVATLEWTNTYEFHVPLDRAYVVPEYDAFSEEHLNATEEIRTKLIKELTQLEFHVSVENQVKEEEKKEDPDKASIEVITDADDKPGETGKKDTEEETGEEGEKPSKSKDDRRRSDDDDRDSSEDDGPGVPIPLVIFTGVGGVGAAAGAAGSGGKNKGKEKQKKKSKYYMTIKKNFGNTISRGAAPVMVYARIVEVTEEGTEVDRPDLTAKIKAFAGDNVMTVTHKGMEGNYCAAEVSCSKAAPKADEGYVSFKFTDKGGSLTNHVKFKLQEAAIVFGQENLTLPAHYEKKATLDFGIFGLPEDAKVTLEPSRKDLYDVALRHDNKYYQVYYLDVTEKKSEATKKEKVPGSIDTCIVTIQAVSGEAKTELDFAIYRVHMGLTIDISGINAFGKLKEEAKGKPMQYIKKTDFEPYTTPCMLKLLTWDEKHQRVYTVSPLPEEDKFSVVWKQCPDEELAAPVQVEVDGEEVAPADGEKYAGMGAKTEPKEEKASTVSENPQDSTKGVSASSGEVTGDGSVSDLCAQIANGTLDERAAAEVGGVSGEVSGVVSGVSVYKSEEEQEALRILRELELKIVASKVTPEGTLCYIYSKVVLDPPARYRAILTVSTRWNNQDYVCKKEVTVRSQPLRESISFDQQDRLRKMDRNITQKLDYIQKRIFERNLLLQLMPLYKLVGNMLDGYSYAYGYDAYQVATVFQLWKRFNDGSLLGANAEAEDKPPTLGDQAFLFTMSLLQTGKDVEDHLGFFGRLVVGDLTLGMSELVLSTLSAGRAMVAYAENPAVDDRNKSAWGMFWAGAKVVGFDYLQDQAMGYALKKLAGVKGGGKSDKFMPGSMKDAGKYYADQVGNSLTGIVAKKTVNVAKAAKTMAVNFTESGKRFSMAGSGKMTQNALNSAKSMEQAAIKAADEKLKLAQSSTLSATEDLAETVRKRAMADGEELVKKLEAAVLKNADEATGATKAALEQAVLAVQKNKSAQRFLNKYKGVNAQKTRSAFNYTLDRIYDDVTEAAKTAIAEKTRMSRDKISVINATSTNATRKKNGEIITFDKDWTYQFEVDKGVYVNVDLDIQTNALNDSFYRRVNGGIDAPSPEVARMNAKLYDQAVVAEGHGEMYGTDPNDLQRAINPNRQGEKFTDARKVGDAITFKGKDRFADAMSQAQRAEWLQTEGFKIINENAQKANELLARSVDAMKEASDAYQEGLRQLYKQYNRILKPRNVAAMSRGSVTKITPQMEEMMEIVKRCADDGDVSWAVTERLLKDKFNTNFGKLAEMLGDLAVKIDQG